jgi:hypothetical protein
VLSRATNTLKDTLKASVLVVKWGVDLETGSGSAGYDKGIVNGIFLVTVVCSWVLCLLFLPAYQCAGT